LSKAKAAGGYLDFDCERRGFETIKLFPEAAGARSERKLQIACTDKRSLCGNASSAAAGSNERVHSATRPAARMK
jgi:hypothetical protein